MAFLLQNVRRKLTTKQPPPAAYQADADLIVPGPAPGARRRILQKQPAPAHYPALPGSDYAPPPPGAAYAPPEAALAALADEAWSELTALSDDARRKHVHWVHVRTHDASHRQPESFTRESFWHHLERVYRDVYPSAANRIGSMLSDQADIRPEGALAKKKQSQQEEHT